jgi:hypothetical protein
MKLVNLINICCTLVILIIGAYLVYKYINLKEHFDSEVTKISGTATFLNSPGSPSQAESPSEKYPADSEVNNEQPSEVVASPAEIERVNKIIHDTVPVSPQPLEVNFNAAPVSSSDTFGVGPSAQSITSQNQNPHAIAQNFPKLNTTPVPMDPSQLSPKEKQLFDAFLEERISDEKIVELIEAGTLTESIVEKFLKMIDDLPEGPAVSRTPRTLSKQGLIKNNNDNLLEGFTGNVYASANGF